MKNFVVLIQETVHVVESVYDSTSVDIESDGTITHDYRRRNGDYFGD